MYSRLLTYKVYIPGSLQFEIGFKILGQQKRRKKDQNLACS